MKKEVTLNLFSNGQPIKVTTTLVITQAEIDQIFAQKEREFMKTFGCAPAPEPSPFNQVDDFSYDSYEEDSEEESVYDYTRRCWTSCQYGLRYSSKFSW